MAVAHYTRLKNGTWGARVQGHVREGDRLTVSMRSGRAKPEVIERVIWSDGSISLCSLASPKKKKRSN